MNATLESLKKIHGDKAEAVFREIAETGGFGSVGSGQGQIDVNNPGGLDLAGVLADGNTAISNKDKDRIAELAGVDRGKATALVDGGETTSSAGKMKGKGE